MGKTLFDGDRLTLDEAIALTADSLRSYGERYRHWAIAYSGGKDSSATVTAVVHLIESGQVPRPASISVLYADTRMELPPLQTAALGVLDRLRQRGYSTQVVLPELDDRFFVYMFGRGVPPPKNRFRWCTSQIKIEPMLRALQQLRDQAGEKILMLTGVRMGESAARDARISLSCSRDGAECGQGWFQEATPEAIADTLAPLLHWRLCHVADWLGINAREMGFPTGQIVEAYGQDEEGSLHEVNARTGCVGCNLASKDVALDRVIRLPQWSHLAPLKRLRPLYGELKEFRNRLQKNAERKKDGELSSNPMRKGPLTMEARARGLATVLKIQADVNAEANRLGRPGIDLINREELCRIIELMAANTWPNGWTGGEDAGDVLLPETRPDGTVQAILWG